MPYKSDLQRRFFHSEGAKKAGITKSEVKEFDESSKGLELPEHVKKHKFSEALKTKMSEGGAVEEHAHYDKLSKEEKRKFHINKILELLGK